MQKPKPINTIVWALFAVVFGYGGTFLVFTGVGIALKTSTPPPIQYQAAATKQALGENIFMLGEAGFPTGKPDDGISLLFVGDIMLARNVHHIIQLKGKGDYMFPFKFVVELLRDADITFGNLEGPVSDKGRDLHNLYSFRMRPEVLPALKRAGFNALSLANNHIGDWGREAFNDTLARLRADGMQYAGAGFNMDGAVSPVIIERAGTRFGLMAFSDVGPGWLSATDKSSGIAIASIPLVEESVRQAAEKVDILIVSFHFGTEYKKRSNARQQQLAHAAIDAGANLVIGHHPHVVQEIEKYHGGTIAYSLGNFVFDQRFNRATERGMILLVTVRDGAVSEVVPQKIIFNKYYQPQILE